MILIQRLIWDEWNREHLHTHSLTIKDVEEAIHQIIDIRMSYRNRLMIIGHTKTNKILHIILSPEDRNQKSYTTGTYYPITAYESEK